MNKQTPTNEQLLIHVAELLEVVKDIREFMPRHTPTRTVEPQLADINWVMDFLGIKRTAFYKNVWRKELRPVKKIGRREYYDKEEVYELVRRRAA